MPERCQKDAWDMPDKYLRYALEMFEIFLRHTLFVPDICARTGWEIPNTSLRYALDYC